MENESKQSLQQITLELGCTLDELTGRVSPHQLLGVLAVTDVAVLLEAKSSNQQVILKMPRQTELARSEDAIGKIRFEADWLRRCAGVPNVVNLIEFRDDDLLPFLVLDRLGMTVGAATPATGLALRETIILVLDLVRALREIDVRGEQHNDIRRWNVLRGPDGWTLIDPSETTITGAPEEIDCCPDVEIVGIARLALSLHMGLEDDCCQEEEFECPSSVLELAPGIGRLFDRMLGNLGAAHVPSPDEVYDLMDRYLATMDLATTASEVSQNADNGSPRV